ncbi:hypothetical protein KP509_36G052100 [Ceratopteris richardii]|uniref:DNA mismatch repair protein MSH5 n=1 Tax=Ceratopteris richardii TaxID=49495 RepID=A0A8T2QD27_CERRI|nr:hypothetical protein KP509_36G052100 [Ceratopteris richardii]
MMKDSTVQERTFLLKSMMNINNEIEVRAAGGLLETLQEEMLIDLVKHNDQEPNMLHIQSIAEISMDQFLTLDFNTYCALQIFQSDKHPSDMGIGKAKEGFSLFGIFADRCATLMGRHLLRTWFLRPIVDMDIINNRLDFIAIFLHLDEIVAALQQSLRHVKDIPRLLKKFSSPSSLSTQNDWKQLLQTIGSFIHLQDLMEISRSQRHSKHAIQNLRLLQKIQSIPMEDLVSLNDVVAATLDFDQSCGESSDMLISRGICEELDELKHIYEGLPDFLEQFSSGSMDEEECFYRTMKTKELDVMLGDIHHKILDMERAILRDLEFRVLDSTSLLITVSDIIAELDCLLAFTSIAREQKYVRPYLTEQNVITITNGRHPMQELFLHTFVPNDTKCMNTGHINIITGPNYSGKSVYVRQVALISFLAHIGSFVPAEEATIGFIDRIFSVMAYKHAVTVEESTFMIDLHKVAIMLRNCTEKSLCILDEFGKGTLIIDGIGILCSTLQYFANFQYSPRVFACTHFSEVFDETLLSKNENIQFFTMSVLDGGYTEGKESQDVVFLYRLTPGKVLPSYGLKCAELAGIPQVIINRAKTMVELIQDGRPIGRNCSSQMSLKDSYYKELVKKLTDFNCMDGDLNNFLKDVLELS